MKLSILFGAAAVLATLLVMLAAGCISPPPEPRSAVDPQQEIVFHNGVILTMGEDKPQAEALAVRGEKITAVGDSETVLAMAGDEAAHLVVFSLLHTLSISSS
jgi:hypothetical protein